MATIDYKEKYEQAMKRARQFFEKPYLEDSAWIVGYIFPELKESKDDRIRKRLTEYFGGYYDGFATDRNPVNVYWEGLEVKEILAWLEKQGKQKQEVEGNPNARKPTLRIIKGKSYLCIKDYRDKNCTFTKGKIYKSDKDGFLMDDEEKDTFERKIWEEDAIEYFFLFEQSKTKDVITDEKQGKKGIKRNNGEIPNSDWSEEDEKILSDIIKDLVHPWNEYIPDRIEDEIKWLKNRLKSLRPQTSWKPSEEMLEALYRVVPENVMEKSENEILLDKLYQGLKYGRVLSKK